MNKSKIAKEAVELYKKNKLFDSEKLCLKLLDEDLENITALHTLGIIFYRKQQYKQAENYLNQVINLDRKNHSAFNNLGSVYMALREYDKAKECFEKSLKIDDEKAETYFNYGLLCHETKETKKAIKYYQKAVELSPKYVAAYNNLANIFKDSGLLTEAIKNYSLAIKHSPGYAIPYNNLGNALKNKGRIQDAISVYRKSVQLNDSLFEAHSSLLLCLNYSPVHDGKTIFEEHKKWGEMHAKKLPKYKTYKCSKNKKRKIRVGYVSPDFKGHSVSYFIEPIIANHNFKQFEIYCYSDLPFPDETTERIKKLVPHWRDINGLSDEVVAKNIFDDQIDILVDLAGHTSRHRLLVFARKPAPIQVTYVGYPNTTGMEEIDFRITDPTVDPYGVLDKFYTETLLRMPKCFLTYKPPIESPEVSISPYEKNGFITFGSFMYYLPKLNKKVMNVWKDILLKVENSKLMMKSKSFMDEPTIEAVKKFFVEAGVSQERLIFKEWTAEKKDHLGMYDQIDIALDTFPYNGTTTICEALWMGVPVVTMAGQLHASRVGASILHTLGLPELVGVSEQDYVEKAVQVVADEAKLSVIRSNLRSIMKKTISENKEFTSNLEEQYRKMFEQKFL